MPLFNRQIHWRGMGTTVVVEILVLLPLGFAVVRYVEWSSDAAQAEFMSAPAQKRMSLLLATCSACGIPGTKRNFWWTDAVR
jgi:hypothetical protein